MTVRAAIIGLGRWGRSLVNAVHGKTDAIQFTAAYTRTRGERRGLLPREEHPAARPLRGCAGEPGHRRGGAGDAAQPARRAGDGGGGRRQAHPCREAADARPAERRSRGRGGASAPASCWRSASTGAFIPRVVEIRKRLADGRLGQVMSMVGAHTTSTGAVHRRPTTGARSRTRRRAARITAVGVHSIDHMIEFGGQVRDVLATTGRYIAGPSDDTTNIMLRFKSGATGLLFCSVATATTLSFTAVRHQGARRILQAQSGALSLRAGLDRGADRAGHRAAGRDHRERRRSIRSTPS